MTVNIDGDVSRGHDPDLHGDRVKPYIRELAGSPVLKREELR